MNRTIRIFMVLSLTVLLGVAFLTSCRTKHEHDFGEWSVTKEATCIEVGERSRACLCGEKDVQEIAAKGHNHESVITDPTCTEKGYTTHTCACGDAYISNHVDAKGHTPGERATCTEAQKCMVCQAELVSALGHKPGEWVIVIEATESENGLKAKKCTACGETVAEEMIPATGNHEDPEDPGASEHEHTIVMDDAVAPTCTESGLTEGSHCGTCGEILVAQTVLKALGHTVATDKAIVPTCTKTGLTEGKHCSVCKEVLAAQEEIPETGHTFGEWYETKAPTEKENGEKRRDCENCGAYETGSVAPLNHSHSNWDEITLEAIAPTCTKTGLTEGKKCSGCGEVLVEQKIISATGHTTVIDKAVAPTCTESGLTEGSHCGVCGETLVAQTVLESLGHTVVTDEAIAPTCTKTGLTEGKHCGVCGETLVAQTVLELLGHTVVTDETIAPTCTKTGLTEGKHCSVCKEVLAAQEEIPEKGHTPGAEATCMNMQTCTVCGTELTAAKGAHSFNRVEYVYEGVRYFCTECGIRKDMLYECDHYFAEIQKFDGGTVNYCVYCSQLEIYEKNECSEPHIFTTVIEPTFYDVGLESAECGVCGYAEVRILQPLNTGSYVCDLTVQQYADAAVPELGILAKSIYMECVSSGTTSLYAYPYGDLVVYKEIRAFVQELVKDESTEYGKARKIYDWILQNIDYSQEAQFYNVSQVWDTKKAVCSQFVQLMHDMLSAADIMSSYTGGYSSQIPWNENTSITLPTIYQHVYDTGHAIVTCYVDGDVIFIDPTWGNTLGADQYFDMSNEFLASYFIPVEINLMKIIPEGIDVRNYDTHIRRVGDHILSMAYGEIIDGSSYFGINNLQFYYNFLINNDNIYQNFHLSDGYQYVGSAIRNCYVMNANDIIWFFLPDGTRHEYGDVLLYVLYMNSECDKSIDIPMIDMYDLIDGCLYRRLSAGYELESCNTSAEEVTVPGRINDLPVLYIGQQAFMYNLAVKKLIIQEGVVEIRSLALSYSKIEELYLPASLENIYRIYETPIRVIVVSEDSQYFKSVDNVLYTKNGDALIYYPSGKTDISYSVLDSTRVIYNISYNPYVESLILPETLERIDSISFMLNLSSLNLPSSLKSISDLSFTKLSSLVIPDRVTDLGSSNFAGNEELKFVVLPKDLVELSYSLFEGCYLLESIEISNENENWITVDGVLFNKEKTKLFIYPKGKKDEVYVIPEGVTELSGGAFAVQGYLKELILPSTLKILPISAINTTHIEKINLNYIEEFNGGTFSGCDCLTLVVLSTNVKKIGSQEFFKCNLNLVIENPELETERETFMRAEGVTIFLGYEEIGEKEMHWMSYVKDVYTRSQWEYVDGVPTPIQTKSN